ncbi:MAG: hypothetical protein CL840_08425 [Crocinitomicaceae bacterium]|nr:hypothetical protein [Crocinitomicaceae bacterium]|tara:strand:+ start:9347 stop:10630 length:1284 start_codon:yes stop_codon:yes gene_type:complete
MRQVTLTLILIAISAVTLHAQIYYDSLSITTCDQYTWRGNTYTSSGIYFDSVKLATIDTAFSFTGGDQSFNVPGTISFLNVELKGAGGGVGFNDYIHANGGSGAHVKGTLSVSPGALINVIVGEGGASGIKDTNKVTYGGGTAGTYINNGSYGGAGGGRTALQINGNDVVSAGGGGGGGSPGGLAMITGGAGGSGTGPNGGGTGGGHPIDSTGGDGAGGFSYLTDTLFKLVTSNNGGANNAGDSAAKVDGGSGQALISWVKDSVYVLNLTINQSDTSVSMNGSTLTANQTGVAYQWLDCDNNYSIISGETGQALTATINGNYAVELNKNGCKDTSTCVRIKTVSVYEFGKSIGVSVYPNPTTGLIYIDVENIENVSIEVVDALGQVVVERKNMENTHEQFILNESPGVYFIHVNSNGEIATYKVLLK